jgi:hypothetical protein
MTTVYGIYRWTLTKSIIDLIKFFILKNTQLNEMMGETVAIFI